MSERTESNLNEMINAAGAGDGVQLPPAFVMVNPRQHRRYKKNNQQFVDGRSKGAKTLFSRISRRKKMKEELDNLHEAQSETERAQKTITQQKKLTRQKELQDTKDKAKKKMVQKSAEMQTLLKARLSDFKKKASSQEQKVTKKESIEIGNEMMMKENADALDVALQVATSELNPGGEFNFAKIQFSDGSKQNLDNFSAKRIAACYAQLDDDKQQQFRYMLNRDAVTFQSALDFAIRNV